MSGNGSGGGRAGSGPGQDLLLTACEHFLNARNFDACRKYALQAQSTDPTNPAAAQMLAASGVLSSAAAESRLTTTTSPNWYSILGLQKHSHDINLIKTLVDTLTLLLNPSDNKRPLAAEAFALVRRAWAVLSDPAKKARFDSELRVSEPDGKTEIKTEGQCAEGTFWTVCPYCYYTYEYPRVYEECCLRCHNRSCRRAFQAVAIEGPPPPEAVVEKGGYLCPGFVPVGISSWTPFGATPKGAGEEELKEEKADDDDNGVKNMDSFVEISDDSDGENMGESNGEKKEREGVENGDGITDGYEMGVTGNGEKKEREGLKNVDEMTDGCKMGITGNGEKLQGEGVKNGDGMTNGVVKLVMRRKKTVGRNTKKVMGKGVRVKMHRTVAGTYEGVETGLGENNDGNLGCGIAVAGGEELGSWGDSEMEEIQFYEGMDDVFVGVQDGF